MSGVPPLALTFRSICREFGDTNNYPVRREKQSAFSTSVSVVFIVLTTVLR